MKLFLLLAGVAAVLGAAPRAQNTRDLLVEDHPDGGVLLTVVKETGPEVLGLIGRRVSDDDEVTFDLTSTFDEASGGYRITVHWDGPSDRIFEDCFDFGSKQWFGGPEQKEQYWPIQNGRLQKYSMISKEDDNAAVSERYWLNSEGVYIYVHPEAPLFVDHHNILDNHICFVAEVTDPYSTRRTHNVLKYDIWLFDNAKVAHQHAVDTYLGKPSGIPEYRMIQYPIWSTWARYSREIDQESLWTFANEIKDSGFPNAQFEIDDLWEICYGSLTVDERKLPDLKQLVQDIKGLGFRVAIWVHPFINKDCNPWYSEALEKGYLVLNEEGSPDSTWWNNNGSLPGYIDFTNPEAADWYSSRIQNILDTYDIDTIKFDAGESSWSPQIPVQNGDIDLHPGHIVQTYVRTVAKFGPSIEVRSGMRTQDLPVFIRMVDKDTYWGFNNGLATLVTTLLQMNLQGYTLVLPDMIGGNGYNDKPSKELFVRWLQANVFMPALQIPPRPENPGGSSPGGGRRVQRHLPAAGHLARRVGLHLRRPGNSELIASTIGRSLITTVTSSEDIEGGVKLYIESIELSVQTLMSQIFPIENATVLDMGYVTKESDNGAVIERYWLNSAGEYIYVNPQVPLFVDYGNVSSNQICFKAEIAAPYSTRRNHTELSYDFWVLSDVKAAHLHALANYLGKPSGVPDYTMVKYPIWSTWAQFFRDINETNLIEYASEIKAYGFANSQLEIDDMWEVCYGSLKVNEDKFSNFTKLVQDIKALGYRATIWMHPFINQNCEPWYSEALNNSYVDFTNPAAAEWWYQRVKKIIPVQTGDADLHPHHITQAYVRTCARFGNMIEVRTGFRTQDLPIFVRMVDRDSAWGLTNGLSTIITTTFQMNLNGYTLVLPDMIGGNGKNLNNANSAPPTKELFIRWVQANTFLPAMQFSFLPWRFDNEYLLGEDIIVAPVLVENATTRDIYLPEGEWLAKGLSTEAYTGPIWLLDYPAPLDELPYFVRKGTNEPDAASTPHVADILVAVAVVMLSGNSSMLMDITHPFPPIISGSTRGYPFMFICRSVVIKLGRFSNGHRGMECSILEKFYYFQYMLKRFCVPRFTSFIDEWMRPNSHSKPLSFQHVHSILHIRKPIHINSLRSIADLPEIINLQLTIRKAITVDFISKLKHHIVINMILVSSPSRPNGVILVDKQWDFFVEVVEDSFGVEPVGFCDAAVVGLFCDIRVVDKILQPYPLRSFPGDGDDLSSPGSGHSLHSNANGRVVRELDDYVAVLDDVFDSTGAAANDRDDFGETLCGWEMGSWDENNEAQTQQVESSVRVVFELGLQVRSVQHGDVNSQRAYC
ncbi:hypothetical protein MSG28_012092 [Choristoneura fumiferana]|uniref:Uncharacterized protein n=1 Tax=Choristoneura fumiferana TaxID=7141 RepID=A0ACC0KCJ9_CHOFU|nr:hypothetical protein MSG28_012092 [Choristoneura fumiferana]